MSRELFRLSKRGVLLVDHDVAAMRHIVLVQALDVETNVVTWVGEVDTRVVHFNSEDLTNARIRGCVRGQENDLLTRLHNALLHTACKHIADTLDLVDARDRHAHWGADGALGDTADNVKHVEHGLHVNGLLAHQNIHALPPVHVGGLLQEVVAHPARDRHERCVLLHKVLFPPDLHQHALHLVGDLIVPRLLVARSVTVHLVDATADLLHAQQVDETRMLASLTLDLTSLVVTLGNGGGEVTIGWDHDESHVSLGGTRDHVLDEVAMPRGVNHSVMPLGRVELFGCASNRHAALALLLLTVHVKCKGEGALAKALSLLLQLLELALREPTKLEDESARGRALPTVDMATDHNRKMLLLRVGRHSWDDTTAANKIGLCTKFTA